MTNFSVVCGGGVNFMCESIISTVAQNFQVSMYMYYFNLLYFLFHKKLESLYVCVYVCLCFLV